MVSECSGLTEFVSSADKLPCEIVIMVATYLHAAEAKQKHLLNRESAFLPILRRMYQDGVVYFLVGPGLVGEGAI